MTPIEKYEAGLRALDAFDRAGKNESEDADRIRDEMEAPWLAMTPDERLRMAALSEALFEVP